MYINNNELLEEIKEYKRTGVMSEKLGEMIMSIAKNYATKGSFAGYSWVNDMISEAITTCVRYLKKFDENKYKEPNPFAYITTICRNSFINFIKEQNNHSRMKSDLMNKTLNHLTSTEVKGIDYTDLI